MSQITAYERFLSSPNPNILSETATLSYVPSLQAFKGADAIVKHLQTQESKHVKRKSYKVINRVEGSNALVLEVETTIEFVSTGGAYLPGLDSFIEDHVATIPVTHFVNFDRDDKISQIRLAWDQASLLKQVEVIGARGRNWPVHDGKDQIKMIVSSNTSAAAVAPTTPPRGREESLSDLNERGFSPSKRYIKDPHASLDLFDPEKVQEQERTAFPTSVAPRASAKPPPREHSELFAAGHEDLEATTPNGSRKVNVRDSVIAPKGATSRRFESANLFEENQDYKEPKIYKTNPARYNHFDIGDTDENDPMQFKANANEEPKKHVPLVKRTNKGQSQWDFADFVTPAKVSQKVRGQDQVNFSFDDGSADREAQQTPGKAGVYNKARRDNEAHFEMQDDGTPVNRPLAQPKPRKDANTHFDFTDEPTPAPRRIIARNKAAAGLYTDNVVGGDDEDSEAPLSNITNTNGRRKDFASHWDVADDGSEAPKQRAAKGRAGKGFESHFSFGDEDEPATKPARTGGRQQEKNYWDF